MDGQASVVLMAKIAAFAEVLWPDAESTAITRGGDDYLDNFGLRDLHATALLRIAIRSRTRSDFLFVAGFTGTVNDALRGRGNR